MFVQLLHTYAIVLERSKIYNIKCGRCDEDRKPNQLQSNILRALDEYQFPFYLKTFHYQILLIFPPTNKWVKNVTKQ